MPDTAALPEIALRTLTSGQVLARGTCRHLRSHNFTCIEEFTLATGRRVDVMALGPKGEIWVVECKSSRADFITDAKWTDYLGYCDRYFWAVDDRFPVDLLPEGTGLIIADGYDAELLRMGPETRLAGARRKALTLQVARQGLQRLQALRDPGFSAFS
ncbi:MmcB family DNA repair protein [Pseudoruegeria sp. SK021]|uniref:MmcB family DNA repair protein n=1 Tax=Pseudoruegeria sp. SK021 TaxID=1933035 RepID=UPI000A24E019|nr:MmcB family DNA repair protein [Pseudoruegeria sp. SK021]OSP56385.1 hypothetical protein BV911_02680 [Pseudoruegeria sp. SK021]